MPLLCAGDWRFKKETEYDWLGDADGIGATAELVAAIGTSGRCLILGCGTSTLAHALVKAGVRPDQLVSTDFSSVVLDSMRAKYGASVGDFMFADMTKLEDMFPAAACFDVVVDKCSIDALTVDPGDVWDPDEKTRGDVTAVLRGVHHVLNPAGGVFFSYSFNQPHFRKPLLQALPDKLSVAMTRSVELGFKEVFVFELRPVVKT